MRNRPRAKRWTRRTGRVLALCVGLAVSLGAVLPCAARAEAPPGTTAESVYIAPKLPSDVDPYDPEHPEELQEEQLYAKAAILIEAKSGEVIFEKNADERMYPASTTKILTVLLGIMGGDLGATVTMSETANTLPEGSSSIPMETGETINFKDLLYATMIRSGNEGANLIAETLSGNYNDFALLMNQAAAMYGCTGTNFVTPSGLFNNDHYTTARDMAKIAQAAMENETFREIARTYNYSLPRSNLQRTRVLVNPSDHLMNPSREDNPYLYPGTIGIKSGFLNLSGYCYIGAAEREGVELISVVLFSSKEGRWMDTIKLFDYGFSQFVSMTPVELYNLNPMIIETAGFSMDDPDLGRLPLDVRVAEGARDVNIVATKADMEDMARNLNQVVMIEYSRDFTAPIQQGETMGRMTYYPPDGGSPIVYDLVAGRAIQRRLNAPKSLAEIEAEVMADPNPLPPFSVELLLIVLSPFVGIFIVFKLLGRLFRRSGRHKKGRVPKPKNRYYH